MTDTPVPENEKTRDGENASTVESCPHIVVTGDIGIDLFNYDAPVHQPGIDLVKPETYVPTDYNVNQRDEFFCQGGAIYVAEILDSMFKDLKGNSETSLANVELHATGKLQQANKAVSSYSWPMVAWTLKKHPIEPGSKEQVFRVEDTPAYIKNPPPNNWAKGSNPIDCRDYGEWKRYKRSEKIPTDKSGGEADKPRKYRRWDEHDESASQPCLSVIIDRDFGFRQQDNSCEKIKQAKTLEAKGVTVGPGDRRIKYVVTLDNRLPGQSSDANGLHDPKQDKLWDYLSNDQNAGSTVVIVSANLLRASGCPLSQRVSWEKTVEDFISIFETSSDPGIQKLRQYGFVVVKFGVTGCVVVSRDSEYDRSYHLVYDPTPPTPYFRSHIKEGRMRGGKSILAASIVQELIDKNESSGKGGLTGHVNEKYLLSPKYEWLLRATGRGLTYAQSLYRRGICAEIKTLREMCRPHTNDQDEGFPGYADVIEIGTYGQDGQHRQNTVTGKWLSLVDVGCIPEHGKQKDTPRFEKKEGVFRLKDTCYIKTKTKTRKKMIQDYILRITEELDLDQGSSAVDQHKIEGLMPYNTVKREDLNECGLFVAYTLPLIEYESANCPPEIFNELKEECLKKLKTWFDRRQGLFLFCAISKQEDLEKGAYKKNRKKFLKDNADHKDSFNRGEIQLGLEGADSIDKIYVSRTLLTRLFRAISKTIDETLDRTSRKANLIAFKQIKPVHEIVKGTKLWKILDRDEYCRGEMQKVGKQIVLYGIERAMNHPGTNVHAPVLKIEQLSAVYRRDVENYQAIQSILRQYHDHGKTKTKPISIGVFGAPGGGKSFGVTQIGESFEDIEAVTYNVSQMEDVDGIRRAMTEIRDINLRKKIPLAFFDEFDAPLDGKPLGWLKYFLAPMQDGTIDAPGHGTLRIGRAIFVFAGGTCHTFQNFSIPEEHSFEPGSESSLFRAAKAPDFISRLRGYIDIPGINKDGDHTPFIQRAMILRAELQMRDLIVKDENGGVQAQRAKIDEQVVAAILDVESFKHGARSISAILDMCVPFDEWIKVSSLPIAGQLSMHIGMDDAQRFYATLQKASYNQNLWMTD